jgi:hypothetical protein
MKKEIVGIEKDVVLYLEKHPNSRMMQITKGINRQKGTVFKVCIRLVERGYLLEHKFSPFKTGKLFLNPEMVKVKKSEANYKIILGTLLLINAIAIPTSYFLKQYAIIKGVLFSSAATMLVVFGIDYFFNEDKKVVAKEPVKEEKAQENTTV